MVSDYTHHVVASFCEAPCPAIILSWYSHLPQCINRYNMWPTQYDQQNVHMDGFWGIRKNCKRPWNLVLFPASLGFPGGSDGKESACKAGNPGLIPGLGRSPGEGNGNPAQYSCLENPMDGGAWQGSSGITKSWTWLSDYTHFTS